MTAPGRHRIRRTVTAAGFTASCACGWTTTRRSRELRDRDAAAHEVSHAAERVGPVSAYVCRDHPDEPVTWRGTGCPICEPHQQRSRGRQQRLERRRALDEAYERITGGQPR